MYTLGVDVGSTYTKYCIADENGSLECFSEPTPIRQKEYFDKKLTAIMVKYGIRGGNSVVCCGYGRKNVGSFRTVSELSALAAGIDHCMNDVSTVLDIGGQDTKLIYQKNGKIKSFFMNDKCAAGCGMFLANVLSNLDVPFELLDLRDAEIPKERLSSTCAVFAQSEIVSWIAEGITENVILRAVIVQILSSAKTLIGKTYCDEIALSGGLTLIPGIDRFAEHIFDKHVIIPPYASYLSAIGCAETAMKICRSGGEK